MKNRMPSDIDERIEYLGSDACTLEEKRDAVTDDGMCLICGLPWLDSSDPLKNCPHDEIQVIALLRARLAEILGERDIARTKDPRYWDTDRNR